MADYVLSAKADEDLAEIYHYSLDRYGEASADSYLLGLEERLLLLANRPLLGRSMDHIREGYLQYEYANHSIYYRVIEDGILVIRVLHKRMDIDQNL